MSAETVPDSDRPEFVWKMYTELSVSLRHFNELQRVYRALASTWLLAGFGGMAFALDKRKEDWLLLAFISGATLLGIAALWVLDVRVYHRLLKGVFDAQRALILIGHAELDTDQVGRVRSVHRDLRQDRR